jgi:hypothetical protein
VIAAGLGAIAATASLAFAGTRSGSASGPPGPEGVPIPRGAVLAPPARVHTGEHIDGIGCLASEQIAFHIHAHVRIDVLGKPRQVPPGIGIGPPRHIVRTPVGAFVSGGSCFMWLHTHAADGIVHIESPVERTYRLGEFFDVWGQRLDRDHVGPARGAVTAFVNGRRYTGDLRQIPLLAHNQIELEVGRPLVKPEHITFPNGL